MSTTTQRPTPETENNLFEITTRDMLGRPTGTKEYTHADFARNLERERDEALAKLSTVYRWIERNHPDGFIDSQSHVQNLDRVADAWHDKLEAMREAIKEAYEALTSFADYTHQKRICTPSACFCRVAKHKATLAKLQPFLKP